MAAFDSLFCEVLLCRNFAPTHNIANSSPPSELHGAAQQAPSLSPRNDSGVADLLQAVYHELLTRGALHAAAALAAPNADRSLKPLQIGALIFLIQVVRAQHGSTYPGPASVVDADLDCAMGKQPRCWAPVWPGWSIRRRTCQLTGLKCLRR